MVLIRKVSEGNCFLLAGIFYTLFITVFSLFPSQDLPKIDWFTADKIGHIGMHFILCMIWLLFYFTKNIGRDFFKGIGLVFGLCLFYGIVIEIFQEVFTASRTADVFDVAANVIGSTLGVLVFWKVKPFFKI